MHMSCEVHDMVLTASFRLFLAITIKTAIQTSTRKDIFH